MPNASVRTSAPKTADSDLRSGGFSFVQNNGLTSKNLNIFQFSARESDSNPVIIALLPHRGDS